MLITLLICFVLSSFGYVYLKWRYGDKWLDDNDEPFVY